jgi:hypothetical protein
MPMAYLLNLRLRLRVSKVENSNAVIAVPECSRPCHIANIMISTIKRLKSKTALGTGRNFETNQAIV